MHKWKTPQVNQFRVTKTAQANSRQTVSPWSPGPTEALRRARKGSVLKKAAKPT